MKLIFEKKNVTHTTVKNYNLGFCDGDWQKFIIDTTEKCLKYGGKGQMRFAYGACLLLGAKVPIPTNSKENTDLAQAAKTLGLSSFTLDIYRKPYTNRWRNFSNDTITYFNWYPKAGFEM